MKKKTPAKKSAGRKHPSQAKIPTGKLAAIRKQLVAMRDDLMRTVRKQEIQENTDVGDSVDEASRSIEKELLFELSDNERVNLDQIEAALRKIDKGTYGNCESCQKAISKPRLNALPFARYCIECQSSSESAPELVETPGEFRGFGGGAGAGEDGGGGFER